MDWHFRVHRRLADAERRSQHRSWYVSENDWVHSREDEEENVGTATAPAAGAAEGGEGSSGGPGAVPGFDGDAGGDGRRWDGSVGGAGSGGGATSGRSTSAGARGGLRYIAVPDDASLTNSVCPVCQERFEMKWLDEAQEWVWMDAVRVGDRVFHASCHREAYGGSGGGGAGVASGASGVSRYGNRGTPDPVLGKRKAEPGW